MNGPGGSVEELEHTADRALRVRASTLQGLFAAAAWGMFALMADLEAVQPVASRAVRVQALDLEMLLVEWLNELIFLHEQRGELYSRFEITELEPATLRAQVWGQPASPTLAKIKAATYHDLELRQGPAGWQATIVFDV